VRPQRTKKEYTEFCQALVAAYPKANKLRFVQDNLNTDNASSFYEHLPADEALALAQRFEFYYTPKSASWLNMIEIEFRPYHVFVSTGAYQLSSNWQQKSWR